MSTIRVNTIQHTTANSGNMILHANGNVSMLTANSTLFIGNTSISNAGISVSGSAVNALNPGMRNRLINGDMRIDQRNAGASVSPDNQYIVDRWFALSNVLSKFTVQQNAGSITPPTGFTHYLGCTSSSSYSVGSSDYFIIGQRIEGFNFADMMWGTANAKTITISFWVRSSLSGTFGGFLRNSANARFYPYSYTISSANTWEYKTITIAGDTTGTWIGATNGVGLDLNFNLGLGSTYVGSPNAWTASAILGPTGAQSVVGTSGATWYITGVQVEAGTTATPFEFRHYGQELALCQRYYQQMSFTGRGYCIGSTYSIDCCISWPAMRVAPGFNKIKNPSSTLNLYSASLYGQPYAYTTSSGNFNVQGAASGDMYLYDVRYETTGTEL